MKRIHQRKIPLCYFFLGLLKQIHTDESFKNLLKIISEEQPRSKGKFVELCKANSNLQELFKHYAFEEIAPVYGTIIHDWTTTRMERTKKITVFVKAHPELVGSDLMNELPMEIVETLGFLDWRLS